MQEFRKHLHINEDFLIEHYVNKGLSVRDVAIIAGCSHSTLLDRLAFYKIEVRNSKGTQFPHVTEEFLNEHYVKKDLTIKAVSEAAGCSTEVIRRYLIKFNINKEETANFKEFPEVNKAFLIEHYVDKRLSQRAIAKIVGCSNNLIGKRMRYYEIEARTSMQDYTLEERKEKFGRRGEQHGLWKGGIAPIRNAVRNRLASISYERMKKDDFTCQECGVRAGTKNVHHKRAFAEIIDEIRSENPDLNIQLEEDKEKFIEICVADNRLNDIDNLITLCEQCHHNLHTDSPVAVTNYDILEKRWRDYVNENHFKMSISEMTKEIEEISGSRIRSYRLIAYMQAENLQFSYENKAWLEKALEKKTCSYIAREFSSYKFRTYASQIREKAFEFGLIDYDTHFNDNKNIKQTPDKNEVLETSVESEYETTQLSLDLF
ncbi:hypothetical protein ACFC4S_22885 [Priestia megaterium]|uniref:hypothetical protein n=1 Tax=Priestia megaterium TaxID=1404 RepID=UPI0035E0E65E